MICDEIESKNRYEKIKAETAQDHATKDRIKSDDTNIYEKLGTFIIIYDKYDSIKGEVSSYSFQR